MTAPRDESIAPEITLNGRRSTGYMLFPLVVLLVAALIWALLERDAMSGTGVVRSSPPLPPDTEVVDVADLVPSYQGRPTTWEAVMDAKAAGKAQVVWVYSDNDGDYAFVFDTQADLAEWRCSPAGITAVNECPKSTTPSGSRPNRKDHM